MRCHADSSRRRRSQRGAAVVEFALVTVVLLPLLMGLIDYGLWFSDSLNVRSGVREGVRLAVVQTEPGTPCSTGVAGGVGYSTGFDKMRCVVKQEIGAISGPSYVMIKTTSQGWVKGAPLVVCAIIEANGVTGLLPLPRGGFLYSKTRMSIEVDGTRPSGVVASGSSSTADTAPSGTSWSWCQ